MGVAIGFIILPLAFWYWFQGRLDRHGLPRNPVRRKRLYALSAKIAAILLNHELPLKRIAELSCLSSGAKTTDSDEAFSLLQKGEALPTLAPETSMVLISVHSNVLSASEGARDLTTAAQIYGEAADLQAAAQARRLPMIVAIVVGLVITAVYTLLVYAPWIQLMQDMVKPPTFTG